MLEMRKSVTVTGKSIINGVEAAGFQSTINSGNPEDIVFSSWQTDKSLYKANRVECRADEAAFEDACYELQEEMMSKTETTEV